MVAPFLSRGLSVGLAIFGLSGCGASIAEPKEQELQQQLDALRAQLQRQDERITGLSNEWVLVQSEAQNARATSNTGARVPPSLAVVRLAPEPQAEVAVSAPEEASELAEFSGDDGGDYLRVVKVPPPPASAVRQSAARPTAKPAPAKITRDDAPTELEFAAALAAFRLGKATDAMQLLSAFVTRHPDSASLDVARYWMGECQFELKNYTGAIEQYTRLMRDHPASNKVAESMLKLGLAYERVGDERRARESFASLVQRFPKSAVAELARTRVGGAERTEVRR